MSTSPHPPFTRRLVRAVTSSAALAALALTTLPGSASADGGRETPGTVSVMVLPDGYVAPPGPTSAAMLPGPQSCGDPECVGDFIDACKAAGGIPMDTKYFPPPNEGLEVECLPTSSRP